MVSWKTTLCGFLTAVGVWASAQPGWLHSVGEVLMIVGGLGTGLFARDNNVTSEAAGAK